MDRAAAALSDMDRAAAALQALTSRPVREGSDYCGRERRIQEYVRQEDFNVLVTALLPVMKKVDEIHGHTRVVGAIAKVLSWAAPIAAGAAVVGHYAGFW